MIRQSQRLRRVLRKYALDARMARLETAKAERERTTLNSTAQRIVAARSGLIRENGATTGDQLAALGEWSARLIEASISMQPAIQRAETTCFEAVEGMRRATGRVERIEERIVQTARAEEWLNESQSGSGHRRPKTRKDSQT